EVLHRFDVGLEAGGLAIGYEHDAVDVLKDDAARGVVVDLTRNGVELEAKIEIADTAGRDRQEIEEKRALLIGRERHHAAAAARVDAGVDVLEIRRLPAKTRAVVDDFGRDFLGRTIDVRHGELK